MGPTALKIKALLGLADGEFMQIAPRVTAIRPSHLAAVRSATAGSPFYGRWLDRNYMCSEVPLSTTGHARVCHVGSGTAGTQAALTAARFYQVEKSGGTGPSNSPRVITDQGILGVSSQWPTFTSTGGSTFLNVLVAMTYEIDLARFGSLPVGVQKVWNHTFPDGMAASSPSAGATFSTVSGHDTTSTSSAFYTPTATNWPLVEGPMLLSRGEFYQNGVGYVACNNSDLLVGLEWLVSVGLADNRDELLAKKIILQERPDAGYVILFKPAGTTSGVNPWQLHPLTRGDSKGLAVETGTISGIDFGTANTRWNAAERIVGVFGGTGKSSDGAIAYKTYTGLTSPVALELAADGTVTCPAQPALTTAILGVSSQLNEVISDLRANNLEVTMALGSGVTTNPTLQGLLAGYALYLGPAIAFGSFTVSGTGDDGGVGVAVVNSVVTPMSASQQDTISVFLEPAMLAELMKNATPG